MVCLKLRVKIREYAFMGYLHRPGISVRIRIAAAELCSAAPSLSSFKRVSARQI